MVVTGAKGLLGWHCAARLHSANCAALYRGEVAPFDLTLLGHAAFDDRSRLVQALAKADCVLHFAGVNRGSAEDVETGNPRIAQHLAQALAEAGSRPQIIYANSVHARLDTPYGRSKRIAGEILAEIADRYVDLILPHIFGECAKPYYNNVTATLIDQLWRGDLPSIDPNGRAELLHAGAAARLAIDAARSGGSGVLEPPGQPFTIRELFERLASFHASYSANVFPDLSDPINLNLFNCYRSGGFPQFYPIKLVTRKDSRGELFETARSAGPSQTFLSNTGAGQTRGDHFHTDLVERFVVVRGNGVIRVRKVLTDEVHSFEVSGDEPVAIDMPPLHTHSIENTSTAPLVTFFWSHRHFDPSAPDTFADPVLRSETWVN
jgi:UDP-2-acetamido-2,6-beta-L-arabino-hexul-4-ose reductase